MQLSSLAEGQVTFKKSLLLNSDFPYLPEYTDSMPQQMISTSIASFIQERNQLVFFEIDRERQDKQDGEEEKKNQPEG